MINTQSDLEVKFSVWLKPAFGEDKSYRLDFFITGRRFCQHAILLWNGTGFERYFLQHFLLFCFRVLREVETIQAEAKSLKNQMISVKGDIENVCDVCVPAL